MERLNTTAWYKCTKCKQTLHGSNFYLLPNGARTGLCHNCYDTAPIKISNSSYSKCPECEGIGKVINHWALMKCKKCKGTGQIA